MDVIVKGIRAESHDYQKRQTALKLLQELKVNLPFELKEQLNEKHEDVPLVTYDDDYGMWGSSFSHCVAPHNYYVDIDLKMLLQENPDIKTIRIEID